MMYKAPLYEIKVPEYRIPQVPHFSGEVYINEFGATIPIEYWESRPDFPAISKPIVDFLQKNFMNEKIGIRMLGSMEHPDKSLDKLILTIQELGHDRYDPQRADDQYENKDLNHTELFMLETQIGLYEGINGEEQIQHALNSFYVYTKSPVRVDIVILYDLSKFEYQEIVYKHEKEIAHKFKNSENKTEAILAILKIV